MEKLPDPEDTSEEATPLKAFDAICKDMAQLLEAAKTLIEPDDQDGQGNADEDGLVGADVAPEAP